MRHPNNLDLETVMEAAQEDDYSGFCMACGRQEWNIEPYAENYKCEGCGENKVFGAEQILLCFA